MNNKNELNDEKLSKAAGGWFTNAEVRGYLDNYTNEDNTEKLGQVIRSLKNEAVNSRSKISDLQNQNTSLQGELDAAREAGNDFMAGLGF